MGRTALRQLLTCFAAACVISGCALPVSRNAEITVTGQLLSKEGTPVANKKIELILPSDYGLTDTDMEYASPLAYGHTAQRVHVDTDLLGTFTYSFKPVTYSTAFWVLPPLGSFPGKPPEPFFYVRFVETPKEYYSVLVKKEGVLYAEYREISLDPPASEPVPNPEADVDGKLRAAKGDVRGWIAELKIKQH